MAYVATLATHLVIDGVPLNTPAWEHTNLYTLLGAAAVRGDNVIMPGAVGVRPQRRRPGEMNQTIELSIFGDRDWEGTPYDEGVAGLALNIAHLHTNVVSPLTTPHSVRPALIVLPAPATALSASIQVLGFEISESYNPSAVSASLDITIIGGRFT